MKPAYIGIDGGGTKTDFLAIDDDGSEITFVTLDKGSKPNHYGVDVVVGNLEQGLSQLQMRLSAKNYEIFTVYAGLSGCATYIDLYEPMRSKIAEYAPVVKLSGDVRTNFRAVSEANSGVALLAGTGSAIANFYPNGDRTFLSSLCHGAKDIIFELVMRYQDQQLSEEFSSVLEASAEEQLLAMNEQQILNNQIDTDLLIDLGEKKLSEPVWNEYSALIRRIGDRWVYKATGRIYAQQQRSDEKVVQIVISGGMWKLDYLRNYVIDRLVANFSEELVVRYKPERRAVDGAAILAREL